MEPAPPRRGLKPAAILFLSLFISPSLGIAQGALDIVKKVGEAYANLKTYDFEGQSEMRMEVNGVQYRRTDNLEMAAGDTTDLPLRVRHQRAMWLRLDTQAYELPPAGVIIREWPFYDFARLPETVQSAKLVREESVVVNGKSASCYVIEAVRSPFEVSSEDAAPAPETLWIDKSTFFVLRLSFRTFNVAQASQPNRDMHWLTSFTSYRINGPAAQWLVEDLKSLSQQLAAMGARMAGQPAADFDLEDLDGHRVKLASLRGKVVLLEFWATWCAPCRAEMPVLEKVEHEWAPKGLVVLRITDQPPAVVREFLAKNGLSFATLVNGGELWPSYYVPGIPTLVLIDKTGKIASYDVKILSGAEIRERLNALGMN